MANGLFGLIDNVLDVANLGVPVDGLGLPVLDSEEVPRCGLSLETLLCSRKGL